ncbi:MAG: cysteine--tRNA ligase, partial [Vicinamibacteria bacterium]
MTPYGDCHLGHARAFVVFDVLVRYLRYRGYKTHFVRNFTDIDDRIIARAAQENLAPDLLAEKYITSFNADMEKLGLVIPDVEPRVTRHIAEIIREIEALVAKGIAYALAGDVYFSVRLFPGYGKLSGKNPDDLRAGARVELDERTRDPLDFALWKSAKPGEPSWDSPWGAGRPGWHIECSVMSQKYLGPEFDLHGGGLDLIFPHHENEIAQSEALTGRPFVRHWLHSGFVTLRDEKMSKSLGNVLTLGPIFKETDPEVVRFFLLSNHYRSPIDYAPALLDDAERGLERFYTFARKAEEIRGDGEEASAAETLAGRLRSRFLAAMDDDLNAPKAFAAIFEAVSELNARLGSEGRHLSPESRSLVAAVRAVI